MPGGVEDRNPALKKRKRKKKVSEKQENTEKHRSMIESMREIWLL